MVRQKKKKIAFKALVTSAAGCILTSGPSRERQAKSPPGNCLASLIYQAMAPCETSTNKVAPVQGHAPHNQEAAWADALFSFAFQCGPGPKLCVFPVMEKQPLKSELMKTSPAILNLCSLGRSASPKEKEEEPYNRECSKALSYLLVQTPLLLSGSGPPTICPTCLQPTLPPGIPTIATFPLNSPLQLTPASSLVPMRI